MNKFAAQARYFSDPSTTYPGSHIASLWRSLSQWLLASSSLLPLGQGAAKICQILTIFQNVRYLHLPLNFVSMGRISGGMAALNMQKAAIDKWTAATPWRAILKYFNTIFLINHLICKTYEITRIEIWIQSKLYIERLPEIHSPKAMIHYTTGKVVRTHCWLVGSVLLTEPSRNSCSAVFLILVSEVEYYDPSLYSLLRRHLYIYGERFERKPRSDE